MIARPVLRGIAIAIAIAGVVDPALTMEVPVRQRLTIVAMDDRSMHQAARLQARWSGDYTTRIELHDPASRAAACPSSGGCVVVSHGAVPRRLTAGAAVVGGVRVARDGAADPAIVAVQAPSRIALNAAPSLQVSLRRPVGQVEVFDGDVLVGQVTAGDRTTVVVPFIPLDSGARQLRVAADGDSADVGIIIDSLPLPVFMYEPEASWLGTFVRRALADDPSITLQARTRVAPPVTVTRGAAGRFDARALADVGVVVVAAPHALNGTEVGLLERFVAVRGGSLVLLPDRPPSGPVLRLFPAVTVERREATPQNFGPLEAREVLLFDTDGATGVIEGIGAPVLVERPLGRGRVVASGALDAWRYRQKEERFDAFWTALVADAARAAGPPVRLTVTPPVIAPGAEAVVSVEYQSLDALPAQLVAEGSLDCGGERRHVRLWPGARPGTFDGQTVAEQEGECRLSVAVAGRTAESPLLVSREITAVTEDRLDTVMAAYGGAMATPDSLETIDAQLHRELPVREQAVAIHPMRSSLWVLPFAFCLGAEWWLRRRSGLR